MMTWIALISLVSGGELRAPALTIREPAIRLPVLLEQISKQSGFTLTSEPALRNEVLLISVQRAAPDELLARIAAVTKAKWSGRGDKRHLEIDPVIHAADERRDRRYFEQNLRRFLAALDKKLAVPEETEWQARRREVDRLLWRSLTEQGVETLLKTSDGRRHVLAENPNRFQRLWRPSPQLHRQLHRYGQGLGALRGVDSPKWRFSYSLRFNRESLGVLIHASLIAVCPAGRILQEDSRVINDFVAGTQETQPTPLPASPVFLASLGQASLTASGTLKAVLAHWADGRKLPDDPEVLRIVLDPLTWDPLRWEMGESLLAELGASTRQVVAVLPDSLPFTPMPQKEYRPSNWRHLNAAADFLEEAGWLTVTPLVSSRDGSHRSDRKALSDLYRIARRDGFVSRFELAQKLALVGSSHGGFLQMDFGEEPLLVEGEQVAFSRMMAAMQRSDVTTLRSGREQSLGSLSPSLQAEIRTQVFENSEFIVGPETPLPPVPRYTRLWAQAYSGYDFPEGENPWHRDFGPLVEPSDVLRNGYGEVTVRWEIQSAPIFAMVDEDGSRPRTGWFFSVMDIARILESENEPRTRESINVENPAALSARVGQVDTVQMVVTFAGGYRYVIRGDDVRTLDLTRVYRLGALPAMLADQVAAARQYLRGQSD
jgi:hypothetical protein